MDTNSKLNHLVVEVAHLNRQLLMLQIENLENEILPCQNDIEQALTTGKEANGLNTATIFTNLTAKVALLRSLRRELDQTNKLVNAGRNPGNPPYSDC